MSLQDDVDHFEKVLLAAGGEGLPEPCQAEDLPSLSQPGHAQASTCGCGNLTRVAVPYEHDGNQAGFATVCAICDAATRFPRFQKVEA